MISIGPVAHTPLATIRIATRASPLALWQARHVRDRLLAQMPGLQVELVQLSTRGDEILDRSLAQIGGKGLFIKELELALRDGRADLAVHSLKDLPMVLAPEFELAVVLERADPRDCFVSARYSGLAELPAGARVGTSSLRREMSLRARFPQLQIAPVRGNVGTRLARLDRGEFDALIMAAAGFQRLGLAQRIAQIFDPAFFLPAPGQGALAIETRAGDRAVLDCIAHLEHAPTRQLVSAERAVSRGLGGSCQFPLAAHAQMVGPQLRLDAWAGNAAQGLMLAAGAAGAPADAESIGLHVVQQLKAQGVDRLLAAGP